MLSECSATRRLLDRYLFPELPRLRSDGADLVLRVEREGASGYVVRSPDSLVVRARDSASMVLALGAWLDDELVRGLTDRIALHAGAACWRGRAALLPGPSHAGKSALVSELLISGWEYWSDEYALVDCAGLVHPYPRALVLRSADGTMRAQPAATRQASTGRGPAPVRLVVRLDYRPGARWNVQRVAQSQMILELLKNTPQPISGVKMAAPLVRLAAGAACYAGVRGEAGEAAERLRELVECGA